VAPQHLARVSNFDDGGGKRAVGDSLLEHPPGGGESEPVPGQDPANAPRPMAERYSVPFGGLIRLS
jgi:hypothetical protein